MATARTTVAYWANLISPFKLIRHRYETGFMGLPNFIQRLFQTHSSRVIHPDFEYFRCFFIYANAYISWGGAIVTLDTTSAVLNNYKACTFQDPLNPAEIKNLLTPLDPRVYWDGYCRDYLPVDL
ncbi:MAG: hypothetical protein ACUVV4_06095 [Candidatus Bathyarchaeia archaeon]